MPHPDTTPVPRRTPPMASPALLSALDRINNSVFKLAIAVEENTSVLREIKSQNRMI